MKKILYIMCAVFTLASCNKEELLTDVQNPDGFYTFDIGIEEPDYVVRTKAAVSMGRYMLEMYEGSLDTTPVKMENSTGKFNVALEVGVDYVCLFWADNGTGAYDATSLKAVKQQDETKQGTVAYFANVTVNGNSFDGAIKLKRAVAELSFIDKNGLTAANNTLKITYPYASATFNLGNGTVTHATGSAVRTITGIVPAATATTAFVTDFVLAPTVVGTLAGLKLQLNEETEKSTETTNIRANFKTKITGEYQPKPPTPPSVGDFYMKDGTWIAGTTDLSAEQQADCIGIVYWVGDPTANDAALKRDHPTCTNGLIVALTGGTSAWQSERYSYNKTANEWITANATSYESIASGWELADPINRILGYNNTKAIEMFNAATENSTWKIDVVEKAVAYRTTVPTPASNSGWFLPSAKELSLLCGLEKSNENVNNDGFGFGNCQATNTQLKKVNGATEITEGYYWSSTESNIDDVWYIRFYSRHSESDRGSKVNDWHYRIVSAF